MGTLTIMPALFTALTLDDRQVWLPDLLGLPCITLCVCPCGSFRKLPGAYTLQQDDMSYVKSWGESQVSLHLL